MATRGVDRGYFDAGVARPARATYGLPEAPQDGFVYGRQDGTWVVISDGNEIPILPATEVPLANASSGGVGSSSKYAREDHYHPAIGIGDVTNLQSVIDGITSGSGFQVALELQDEGSAIAAPGIINTVNFVGAAVSASLASATVADITITASSVGVPPYLIQNAGVL